MKSITSAALVLSLAAVITTPGAHASPSKIGYYIWTTGTPPAKMIATHDGICLLSGVTGSLSSLSENVNVYQQDGYWYIGGSGNRGALIGSAHCLPNDLIDGAYKPIEYVNSSAWFGCDDGHCACQQPYQCVSDEGNSIEEYVFQLTGKAAFVQGISGDFGSPSMWQTPSVFSAFEHPAEGPGPGGTEGWPSYYGGGASQRGVPDGSSTGYHMDGVKLIVGTINGPKIDPMTKTNKSSGTAQFTSTDFKTKSIGLPYSKYMCGLQQVYGFLAGGQDSISLITDVATGDWAFGGTSSTVLSANAFCFQYRP